MRWLAILATLAMLVAACNGGGNGNGGGGGGSTPVGGGSQATPTAPTDSGSSEPTRVVVSIYPLAYFTERIGGGLVDVTTLVGPGVEAHDFEPTASDLQNIQAASLVIANGLGLEPWLDNALDALGAQAPEHVLEIAEGEGDHGDEDEDHGDEGEEEEGEDHGDEGEEEEGEDHGEEGEEEEGEDHGDEGEEEEGEDHGDEDDHGDEEGEDAHDHGDEDPHVWLDPLQAIEQVERIAEALSEADSANASTYNANADALIAELRTLHDDFVSGFASCLHETFVASHAAYGHLAERYGLEQETISGLSPAAEPSPQRLAQIVDEVTDLGLRFILVEPVVSDRLAQTVASETDAELLPIHAIESVTQMEFEEVGDYMALMRDNLANLAQALECS